MMTAMRSWCLWLGVVAIFPAFSALAAAKGILQLPDALRTPRENPSGYWRLENGILPIGPPQRPVFQDTVVVFEPNGSTAPGTGAVTLEISGLAFQPRVLPVQVGTTVEFKNLDRHAHVLYSPDNLSFFKPEKTPAGDSRKVRFFAPGFVLIKCDEFPHMEGAVLVLPQLYHAKPDASGQFQVQMPDGRYTLRVFVKNRWVHEQPVEIGASTPELRVRVAPPKERE